MHGAPSYTPIQIIEAGQRAEADGQLQYAVQFYHHLVDHYGDTREAKFAHQRLSQLMPLVPPPQSATVGHLNPSPDQLHRSHRPSPLGQHLALNHVPSGPVANQTPGGHAAIQHAIQNARQTQSADQHVAERASRSARAAPMPVVRSYALGRTVAWVMTISGSLTAICALFAMVAGGALQFGLIKLSALGAFALIVPMSGYGMITGIALVFVGQFARASFDTADATQELVAMARASSGAASRH
jgi:hypothetical protein